MHQKMWVDKRSVEWVVWETIKNAFKKLKIVDEIDYDCSSRSKSINENYVNSQDEC